MKTVLTTLSLIGFMLVLSGCASRSLSEHQCLAGDWQTIGERDGSNGRPATQVLVHQNACGPHNIVPDTAAYRAGWAAGVQRFCSPDSGYTLGLSGRGNPNVCPQTLAAPHQQAYFDGRELYLARAQVTALEKQISRKESRRRAVDSDILTSVAAQADPELTRADRVELIDRTSQLLAEREDLDEVLPALRRRLDDAYSELDDIEQSVALN